MKKVRIQNQKMVGTRVEGVNPKVEISYQEFKKFKWEVGVYKLNLIYLSKILEFNKKRKDVEPKSNGKISWNNLPKVRYILKKSIDIKNKLEISL